MAKIKIRLEVGFGGLIEPTLLLRVGAQPFSVQRQVAPVSGQRVVGQAVFQPQGIDKRINGGLTLGVHSVRSWVKKK